MSSISPLSPPDVAIVVATVAVFLVAGGLFQQTRLGAVASGSERYCLAGSQTLFVLCAIVAAIFLVGYVGLILFGIQTGFWFIWQFFYLLSRFAAVWVLPAVVFAFCVWALVGFIFDSYSRRVLRMAVFCLACLLFDLLLFYALERGFSAATGNA